MPTVAALEGLLHRAQAESETFREWSTLHGEIAKEPWARPNRIVAAMEGCLDVEGRKVRLRLGLTTRFPAEPARIFVVDPSDFEGAEHVERGGKLCYADDEEFARDPREPVADLAHSLGLAESTLQGILSGRTKGDRFDELDALWAQVSEKPRAADSFIEPDMRLRKVVMHRDGQNYVFVADSLAEVASYRSGRQLTGVTERHALYVPLEPSVLNDLHSAKELLVTERVQALVARHLSKESLAILADIRLRDHSEELVVLRVPRSNGGASLLGILFQRAAGHPLRGGKSNVPIVPIVLRRCERSHLVPRGGAQTAFHDRRAIVIGCGAVGGHVSMGLAFTGIGYLDLVDPQALLPENAFRHVLGNSAVGRAKVEGLRSKLECEVPFVRVKAYADCADVMFDRGTLDLTQHDLCIIAVGTPSLCLRLNEQLCALTTRLPVVFTWLEPLGIGGHAMLMRSGRGNAGCYRCLYEPTDDELRENFSNRSDFAAAGQRFTRDHLGCGGRHTPFSAAHARRTADLALELGLDAMQGYAEFPVLRSWKGSAREFQRAGFKTTPRFALPDEALQNAPYASSICAQCT